MADDRQKKKTLTIRLNESESKALEKLQEETGFFAATDLFKHFIKTYSDNVKCRQDLAKLQREFTDFKKDAENKLKASEAKYNEVKGAMSLIGKLLLNSDAE